MRILYLHQYYQTRASYGITRSYELARYLVSRGHQVTVVTGDRSYQSGERIARDKRAWIRTEEQEGIRVVTVGVLFSYRKSFLHRAGAFAAYALLSAWAALRTGPADVVLATSPPLTAGVAGLVIGFLKRAPLVFEVRDLWPEVIEELGVVRQRLPLAALDAMARLTYRGARRVVAVTPGIRRWLIEKRGLSGDKVELVTQGADLDLFPEPDRSAARSRLGFGDEFVVAYAGALGIANKIDVVLEAARRMSGGALFLIIGEGMEKNRLQALAAEWGLDRVKFLPGMARQDIVDHLMAADVGLVSLRSLPVFGTALPNKFFDYLGAGLPVVVNFPGDLARLLEEEGIGAYGGDNDPVRLAQTLEELQRDAAGRAEMGRRARLLAETTFRRDAQSQKVEEILMLAAGHRLAEG